MARTFNYDLREYSFNEAWAELVSKVSIQKIMQGTQCVSCNILPICNQCPGWALLENGDIHSLVDHLCKTARIRARTFVATDNKIKGGTLYEEAVSKA